MGQAPENQKDDSISGNVLLNWILVTIISLIICLIAWKTDTLMEMGFTLFGLFGVTEIAQLFKNKQYKFNPAIIILIASCILFILKLGEVKANVKKVEFENKINEQSNKIIEFEKTIETLEKKFVEKNHIIENGIPSLVHEFIFMTSDIDTVSILGINSLNLIHKYRRQFISLLKNNNTKVQILLLDPRSDSFKKRRSIEEGNKSVVSNRLYAEWKATFVILQDILNTLQEIDSKLLQEKLSLKIHNNIADQSFLFVYSKKNNYLVKNTYLNQDNLPGTSGGSIFFTQNEQQGEFVKSRNEFNKMWEMSHQISNEKLMDNLLTINKADSIIINDLIKIFKD